MLLDRLDPRALTRALPGLRRRRRRKSGGPPSAGVRDRARPAAQEVKAAARSGLRAVAVDGKTSRGAGRTDGTGVHLLGVAEHGGRLLNLATIRATIIAAIKDAGYQHVPKGRHDHMTPAEALCLHGLD